MEKESQPAVCPLCGTQGVVIKDIEGLQGPINEIEEIRQEREEKKTERLEDAFEVQYGGYLKPYRNNVLWKRIVFNLALSTILFMLLFGKNEASQGLKLFDIFKLALCYLFIALFIFNGVPFFKKSKEEKELRKSFGL